jgi:Zn-dependent M28 family amino/carboxypeptidase
VPEGPGINDNGSGSAAVLEAALRLAREPAHNRGRMRFAFWGAEERGLVGSRHHVNSLSEDERRQIAVYINLDMVGSPNFGRFVRRATAKQEGLAAIVREEIVTEFRTHDLPSRSAQGVWIGRRLVLTERHSDRRFLYGRQGANRRRRLSCWRGWSPA